MEHPTERLLQMHLDGDLPTAERWRVEAHVSECPRCANRLWRLEALVRDVASLDASLEPPADLWPGIEARIRGAVPAAPLDRSVPASTGPRKLLRYRWIAAAAAVLVLGVGLGRRSAPPSTPPMAGGPPAVQGSATLTGFDQTAYDDAIAELQIALDELGDELKPETVAAIEENLRIIDTAIADARAALNADPANDYLQKHIDGYMRSKLELLRATTIALSSPL